MPTVPSPPAGMPPPPGAPAPFPSDYQTPWPGVELLVDPGAYRSPRGIATVLLAFFAMVVVASGVGIALLGDNLAMLERVRVGAPGVEREVASWILRGLVGGFAAFFVWVGAGVTFLAWFHRAYSNLPALGAPHPRFSTGYAVGSWFIPVLNIVRPKQIADAIWRHSDPEALLDARGERRPLAMWPVHVWWGLFLTFATSRIGVGVMTAGGADLTQPADMARVRTAMTLEMVGSILALLGAVAAIWFVYQVTVRQDSRAAQRSADVSLDRKPRLALPLVAALAALAVIALVLQATRPQALSDGAIEAFGPMSDALRGGLPPAVEAEPPADEPADEPAAEDPAVEEPAVEEPPADEPAGSAEAAPGGQLGSRWMDELVVGDCFDDPPADDLSGKVEVIACTEPHDNEVFALLELPDGDDVPFDEDRVWLDSDRACIDSFTEYVGSTYTRSTLISWTVFYPDEELWDLGDRAVICALSDEDLEPLEGSMAGTGR